MQVREALVTILGLSMMSVAPSPASPSPPVDPDRVEAAVLAANAAMNAAAESLDVERFFAWILDDPEGSIIQDGRLFRSRAEAKEAVQDGYHSVRSLHRRFDQTHVTVLSDTAALVTSSGTSDVVLTDGRSFQAPFAVSLVFVLRDGHWKLLQGHYSVPNRP